MLEGLVTATQMRGPVCMTVRTVAAEAARALQARTVMEALGIAARAAVVVTALRAAAIAIHTAQALFISRFADMSRASWRRSH
jgi:hypothetical protein